MTIEPYPVHFGGIDFDGTADSNGIRWLCNKLEGWYDLPEVLSAEGDTFPDGIVVTASRNRGRPIVMNGGVLIPRGSPDLWYTAVNSLNAAANALTVPKLLKVDEPNPLQAYVRRTDRLKTARVGNHLSTAFTFQLPLKAADPRKYAQVASLDASTYTLTGSGIASVTAGITIAGTTDTPWVASITGTGTAINPQIRNEDISSLPLVLWNGTLGAGDTLVFNSATRTITYNGANAYDGLDPQSVWFNIGPGLQNLRYHRHDGSGTTTATITYSAAYL